MKVVLFVFVFLLVGCTVMEKCGTTDDGDSFCVVYT